MDTIRKRGEESFTGSTKAPHMTLLDYWQWSGSDLLGNINRGVLAEYIVAGALGLIQDRTRKEWLAWDLVTDTGTKIEVKSAAYVQSWNPEGKLSRISFSIREARRWDENTNELSEYSRRHADVYVFCLLGEKSREKINPLDLSQWEFYVVPTLLLEETCPKAKSISLDSLRKLKKVKTVKYDGLAECITQIAASLKTQD